MILEKMQSLIEKVPWYGFAPVIFYFLYKLYTNADNLFLVVISATGIACFTYLAVHNLLIQPKSNNQLGS